MQPRNDPFVPWFPQSAVLRQGHTTSCSGRSRSREKSLLDKAETEDGSSKQRDGDASWASDFPLSTAEFVEDVSRQLGPSLFGGTIFRASSRPARREQNGDTHEINSDDAITANK